MEGQGGGEAQGVNDAPPPKKIAFPNSQKIAEKFVKNRDRK
jgi:hypothetical protein